uniref:Uncharacterized protein n=1 Tax=Faxonius propinquus nudivirus TaxID=3139431 RepID=A0AAU8GEZ6_9VIRU
MIEIKNNIIEINNVILIFFNVLFSVSLDMRVNEEHVVLYSDKYSLVNVYVDPTNMPDMENMMEFSELPIFKISNYLFYDINVYRFVDFPSYSISTSFNYIDNNLGIYKYPLNVPYYMQIYVSIISPEYKILSKNITISKIVQKDAVIGLFNIEFKN